VQYLWRHIHTITDTYDGSVPLTHFLKNYCKQHPILGSRDRRMLSSLAYSWYRSVKGIVPVSDPLSYEQQMLACMQVCKALTPQLEKLFASISSPAYMFQPELLFPYDIALSAGINKQEWLASMQVQPQLFIKVRKNKSGILGTLREHQIPFEEITDTCLSLPNGATIDALLPADSYVVQDASSQHTGTFFKATAGEHWYDCCSGAGGKSLLLVDACPGVQLTVSDKRRSILNNLEERFKQYALKKPRVFVADAAVEAQVTAVAKGIPFHNIISDVPCSGSGTWARTPEQLHFFRQPELSAFPPLQQQIAINVSRQLKKGGRLIYITCSVFMQENEGVVNAIVNHTNLQVQQMQLINGIGKRADSMFIAVLQ
jgi:16S rRNA (cytosine967-C5)-methyltransferase